MVEGGARSALAGTRFSQVVHFPTIGSTNAWLMDQAGQGAPEGLVVVADHQSEGRGRLGRTWSDAGGRSLLVSVLLRPQLEPDRLHLVTAVVAMAAADACWSEAGVAPELKWPNDLMLDRAKLAGVLAEAEVVEGVVGAVVVGLGLNLSWPPGCGPRGPGGQAGGAALSHRTGRPVERDRVMVAMLVSLEERYGRLGTPSGRSGQVAEYRRRCATLGQVVRIEMAGEVFTGAVVDLTPEGHLLVDAGTCLRRVAAGDVVHLRPA